MPSEKKPVQADPPLVSFSVTDRKSWWKRIIGNEGIKVTIHPLTTLVIVLILFSGTFSLGAITAFFHDVPVLSQVIPLPTLLPTPDPWRGGSYSGTLGKNADGKFYLQTVDHISINLSIPNNVNLEKYVGKRIFASGRYNTDSGVLEVIEATGLEVLPQQAQIVATVAPTPTSTPIPPQATPSETEPTL